MAPTETQKCFEKAIALEYIQRDFYRKAAIAFSHEESAHQLLTSLATDESNHAAALETAQTRAHSPLFEGPELRELISRLDSLEIRLRGEVARPYVDFNELYMRINALETSEINNVFEILTTGVLKEPQDSGPMRDLIKNHVLRVTDFGHRFDRNARLKMLARDVPENSQK